MNYGSPAELNLAKEHLKALLRNKGVLSGCTSYISRKLSVGYYHASRIMDDLERDGFITAADDRGERQFGETVDLS